MNQAFRDAAVRMADWIEDYRSTLADRPVFPRVEPGFLDSMVPGTPPETAESLDAILRDLDCSIVPGLTHWNHPGFMAYFCSSASDPGILAEFATAALNVNAMLWRSSPAATELEEKMVRWVREFVGLPEPFAGVIQDTASTSTFVALVAARERALPGVRERGLAGMRTGTVYGSTLAHSSLDKAVIAAGLGLANLRRVPVDDEYALRPDELDRMLAADREAGMSPVMVCATIGTTSCTSCDPVEEIADVCGSHDVWLHVDAAYAGPAASIPELRHRFTGWERADSIVLNPHKWMTVPIDCSVLLGRDLGEFRASLALTPEYLSSSGTSLMDIGIALGRRFRALKLWFVFRWFGAEGLRAMIRRHCDLAEGFAGRIAADDRFELAAPLTFSTVCFRAIPPQGRSEEEWNRSLLDRVNRSGAVFLSHTELDGRFTIRLSVGNVNTAEADVEKAWGAVVGSLVR